MERCHSSGCLSPVPGSSIRYRSGGSTQLDGLPDNSATSVLHSPRYSSPHVDSSAEEQGALNTFGRILQRNITRSVVLEETPGHSSEVGSSHSCPPDSLYPPANVLRVPEEADIGFSNAVELSPHPNTFAPSLSRGSTTYVVPPPIPPTAKERNSLRSVLTPRLNLFSTKRHSERILKREPLPPRAWSPVQMTRAPNSDWTSRHSAVSNGTSLFSLSSSVLPEKFTQKWPQPQRKRGGSTRTSLSLLEEEAMGFGFESVGTWTTHKWCLLFSVTTVFIYGLVGMTCAIATWFRTWLHADVMYVADYDILVLITLAASILLLTSLLGLTGTLLNSRPILAVYALLLWPCLISMLSIGYTTYKRSALSLDRKLNLAWSQWYTPLGRLIIQDSLQCCGYYNPLHDATPSKRCFSRTSLPGCKSRLFRFEQANLGAVWSTVFSLVPLHLFNIFVALLCANHVTKRFGKGITPKGYRLTGADARILADRGIVVPQVSRAPTSVVFREDRMRRT